MLPPHPEHGRGRGKQKPVSHSHTLPPTSVFGPDWHSEWELLEESGWGRKPQDPRNEPRMSCPLENRLPGGGVSLVTGAASLRSESGFYHALCFTRRGMLYYLLFKFSEIDQEGESIMSITSGTRTVLQPLSRHSSDPGRRAAVRKAVVGSLSPPGTQ